MNRLVENLRFAFTAIRGHKLRAVLTISGIVIGVATVIAMVSLIVGFNNSVMDSYKSFGATLVQFQKFDPRFGPGRRSADERNRKNLTYEDAVAMKRLCPSMLAVSPERYWFTDVGSSVPTVVYNGTEATPDTVGGVTEEYPVANNHFARDGRFITEADVTHHAAVIVLGGGVAETLFPMRDPIGKIVTLNGRRFTVIGVLEKQGSTFFESTDSHVLIPITTFDTDFPWIKRVQGVNIATVPKSPELVSAAIDEGTSVLRMLRKVPFNKPNDFGIMTPDKLIENFKAISGVVTLAMLIVSSIALLVGGVGIMNIMLVSVTERTREIGVRKAIGAVRRDIVVQFLIEAMSLAGMGGAIGISTGIAIAAIVRAVSPLQTATPLWSIVVGFSVSLSIGLVFGVYPAWKAAKLDPIESLRYE
ncbi:MAG: ABC transporter permease [Acidobacteria bacterium]|nr:ABC transporter permease [Acidobacteriota bacterium]